MHPSLRNIALAVYRPCSSLLASRDMDSSTNVVVSGCIQKNRQLESMGGREEPHRPKMHCWSFAMGKLPPSLPLRRTTVIEHAILFAVLFPRSASSRVASKIFGIQTLPVKTFRILLQTPIFSKFK